MKKNIAMLLCFFLLLIPIHSYAANHPPKNEPLSITTENVTAFADDYFSEAMEKNHVPGAVIIVVKDNEVIYEKGFGYANLESNTEVDPKQSLFRIGSVTKLFTATAIMQLVEQGLVDVEQDVNSYLTNFQVDTGAYSTIKIKHLLTHTPGFDERIVGMAARDYQERGSLEEYLKNNQPQVLREPGKYVQYSNYGMGLLGLVIEEVSGLSYEDYIQQNILGPLGMNNTHVLMNVAAEEQLAHEYAFLGDQYHPLPLYDFYFPPAGSMISTAEDMAAFLLFHLNNGTWNNTTVLQPQTIAIMHERQFSQHPQVQGFGYGFFERLSHSHRFLEHGGNTGGTNSFFMLDKEQNVGVFISNNSTSGALMTYSFIPEFIDNFYPTTSSVAQLEANDHKVSSKEESLERYTGTYYTNRNSQEDISKLPVLLMANIHIQNQDNQALLLNSFGEEYTYVQKEPLVFVHPETSQTLAFEEDEKGNITHLFFSDSFVYEKKAWYQEPLFHLILLVLLALIAILTGIVHLFQLSRRILARKKNENRIEQKVEPALPWYSDPRQIHQLLCWSVILYLIVFLIGVSQIQQTVDIFFVLPTLMKIALLMPFLPAFIVLLQGISLVRAWISGSESLMIRFYYTGVCALSLCVILILRYYNFTGL
ncbi:serine hydrolase domain-containing protein [Caldalkalibacillus mannanilyticus]|uniref:serine hydrolase domain-containing protein n=1 Tax=Caldalkalibacillus mannanilyticus TaxID=1418 RepID=UPI00131F25B5|nr:serine hydrolase domain-containing protein [Caldalkalibacillus mannanilyticus]